DVDVKAARPCAHDPAVGQRSVAVDERGETLVAAVRWVDVDDHQAAGSAGADGDIGARPAGPPLPDAVLIGSGGLEPARDARMLGWRRAVGEAARAPARAGNRMVTREHGPASSGVDHCGVDRSMADRAHGNSTSGTRT